MRSLALAQYENLEKERGDTYMEVDAIYGEKNADLQNKWVDTPCENDNALNIQLKVMEEDNAK